jgi:hypothetical protein
MNTLGPTIWPTALHVEPERGESLHAYLERACAGPLATDCKYVVPEAWPLVLGAIVWKRMKTRARESYSSCTACASDRTYTELLEKYDQSETRMATQRSKADDLVERGAWPEAGEQAGPWSGAPVLDLAADPPTFDGEPIDGSWEKRVRGRPARAAVLGLRVLPRSEVRHVRAALTIAAEAGFRAVALQVRARAYPYPLREYRLTATRGAGAVKVHDVETAQILVRALDAAVAKSGQPAATSPPIQLVAGRN